MAADKPKTQDAPSLDAWIKRLSEREMPIFANTAHAVAGLATNRQTSASELTQVILRDASMTARVLRMANSSYYNPSRRNISTVSRAVVMLGLNALRSICMSTAIVDTLLKGVHKERVAREMARSFHAAVQARELAVKSKAGSPEEVFVAALLYRLGDMAFWCFAGDLAESLDAALSKPGYNDAKAQREVLGFRLQELTSGLSKDWHLGELLQKTLDSSAGSDPRVRTVMLAHDLARSVEQGWDTPKVKHLTQMIAKDLGLTPARVSEMVQANAKEAAKTAVAFGAVTASRLIPLRPTEESRPAAAQPASEPALETPLDIGQAPEPEYHEPDPALQLRILRELSAMLSEQPDLNLLVSMVMEGIFRGVGMDRAVFALLTSDRRWLKAKYALGCSSCRTEDMRQGFAFEMSQPNLFSHVLDTRQPMWVRREPGEPLAKLLTSEIRALARDAPFFIVPLVVDRQVIGLIYGDRQPSARELDEETFSSFNHFCQQAILGLSYYGQRGG